jgi:hypothetical protein
MISDEEQSEEVSNTRHKNCPVSLRPCARDAYLLFQVSSECSSVIPLGSVHDI